MSSINPVNWWHELEGGKIAEQRPPPPGTNDPEPTLSNVPARPAPPDREAMKRLTAGLVADREHAQYAAAGAPLADPSSRTASPNLFGSGTLPPPQAAASASLAAASAPPASAQPAAAPAAPPSPAPIRPVSSAPLAAPEAPTEPATARAAVAAPMPALPAAPPPRAAAAPAPPPPTADNAPPPRPSGPNATTLAFDPGASVLTPLTAEAVKQAAAHRQGQTIVLTGYGDATSSDPAMQAKAMSLAIARAKALAGALEAAGVPASAIQIGGEAAGRGASLRMLQ